MRNLVLYHLLSLDGVAEEPGDWMTDSGDELVANLGRVIADQDTVLLGRGTYDYWVDYWPSSSFQPFADFINQTPKHVFTSSPLSGAWDNSTPIDARPEDHVADLKRQDGADIAVHGSISLAQTLLHAGVVDELRLVIGSTVAGPGRRLFTDDNPLQRFELADCNRTEHGTLLLHYRRAAAG